MLFSHSHPHPLPTNRDHRRPTSATAKFSSVSATEFCHVENKRGSNCGREGAIPIGLWVLGQVRLDHAVCEYIRVSSLSLCPIVIVIYSLRICTNSFACVSGNARVSELRRMASSGDTATPEKVPVSDTEVVSVDLPAPDGWRKKFTPRKGGTPKRNEIMFISPTGEEITNKRQLEQYLRSHAGGPPSSEFDWGTGDTPRRSARLSSKTKATETPEDERPKKERKSSSKKGLKDKSGDTETEALEEAKDAAATNESADQEMTDTEDHAKKTEEEVGADTVDQGATENKLLEKTNENIEMETEELNKEGPEEAVKADTDASIPESGKEEVKEVEQSENEDLPPVSEEKGDENAEPEDSEHVPPAEKRVNGQGNDDKPEDPVVPPQTSEVHKEADPTVKDAKDGVLPSKNDSNIDDRDGTVPNRAQSANCEDGQHQPKASPVNC
ncbi:methyl-CpG-binding domain-containing protein 10-like [Iris pallida]|uniref:Methyl-CpG-binding domain-containing protein 10-like n=1 Tax=Iris pallida TaxID=29817 RepID=A0AAX6FK03_IRIPA|nr:methyl-CpG-binding domain-containing protein 10-like [Iris pallida]